MFFRPGSHILQGTPKGTLLRRPVRRSNANPHILQFFVTCNAQRARSHLKRPVVGSLSDFILRQRVIALWRDIVRTANRLPKGTQYEMKKFAREEFERNRCVSDSVQIRYLVSTGKTQLDKMKEWGFDQLEKLG